MTSHPTSPDGAGPRMQEPEPSLAVVIPTHSRRDLLERAVSSCGALAVVVVDDSPTGLPPVPGVTWLRTTGNTGFARACNQGLHHLSTTGVRAALVLNDDALLMPGAVSALWRAWTDTGGAVGPILQTPRGDVDSAGYRLASWGRLRAIRQIPPRPCNVDAVSGACLLVGTHWRFDPTYRHGMEDIELCRRIRQAGGSVQVVPAARCQHIGGATVATDSARAQRHAVAGHLRLMGGGWRTAPVLALAAAQVARERGSWQRWVAIVRGWRDVSRG